MSFVTNSTNRFRSVEAEEDAPVVQLLELTAAWEAGEDVDLTGQIDSWGEGDRVRIVPPTGYFYDEVRVAG